MAKENPETEKQFKETLEGCRTLFAKKLHDYNASWRMLRPSSLTDQLLIKARRIRSIEVKGKAMVEDDIRSEFVALINYGIGGLIQLEKGFADSVDVLPIPSCDYPTPAERPAFSILSKAKIKATYGVKIPHWETSLEKCLGRMVEKN